MYLDVDLRTAPAKVVLREASEFTSLKLVVRGDRAALAGATAPFGRLGDGGEHVFLAQDALVSLAGPLAADADWRASFDEMVAYADRKGWTDEQGAIRAHVESGD